jgi:WD40 repeat protein
LVIFRTIVGHGSEVVVSPDGNWLAVDTRDGLFVWQLSTGVLKQKLSENRTNYDSIAWSPDSKNIVTTSSVLGVEIWDMENGKFLQNLNKLTGAVTVLNWLPDGKTLVRDTDQGNIALIDSHRGDVLETFHGDALQSSFATSPDGNWLAIKSYFSSIHGVEIINFRDSAFHYVLPNSYGAGLTSESFSRDSRYLVTSGFDGSNQIIQVWKTKDWSLANFWVVGEITENLLFNTLIFNPDGQTVTMYRFRDTGIKAYRISDGSLIQTMETTPIAIIFPPDGKFLLSMTEQLNSSGDKSEQALSFWHVSNGSLAYKVEILPVHEIINLQPPYYHDLPSAIDFSPNGDLFAVGFPDGTVGVFRVSDRQLLQNLTGHTMRVTSVSFSQDGRSLVSGSLDGTIRLWGIK